MFGLLIGGATVSAGAIGAVVVGRKRKSSEEEIITVAHMEGALQTLMEQGGKGIKKGVGDYVYEDEYLDKRLQVRFIPNIHRQSFTCTIFRDDRMLWKGHYKNGELDKSEYISLKKSSFTKYQTIIYSDVFAKRMFDALKKEEEKHDALGNWLKTVVENRVKKERKEKEAFLTAFLERINFFSPAPIKRGGKYSFSVDIRTEDHRQLVTSFWFWYNQEKGTVELRMQHLPIKRAVMLFNQISLTSKDVLLLEQSIIRRSQGKDVMEMLSMFDGITPVTDKVTDDMGSIMKKEDELNWIKYEEPILHHISILKEEKDYLSEDDYHFATHRIREDIKSIKTQYKRLNKGSQQEMKKDVIELLKKMEQDVLRLIEKVDNGKKKDLNRNIQQIYRMY